MPSAIEVPAVADIAGATASTAGGRYVYERRQPERGALYQVVRDNLQTLYAAVEQGCAAPLPEFVRREFEQYMACGLLCRGFAVLVCECCHERRLVAFSCKGRAWCPSCLGRRMAQTGANLVDHVLPRVPLRQFVVTVPFELRARLAYDGALLGAVGRIVVDSVLGFYRRRMRDEAGVVGQSGAVSVVQRASADLRLNPHWHSILLDGVFAPDGQGALVFHPLRNLDTCQLADLLQVIRVRVLGYLERRGVIENQGELTVLDGDLCEREPALAQLAAAAVSGLTPAGPEERCRPPITLRGQLGVQVSAPLSVAELGFSLHAATCASADDARGREALVRYALRPPIAQERLHLLANDLVRIELRRPFRDGTVAVDLDPLSLLCRLAAMVPAPHSHTVHYSGVLGAASKWRSLVLPPTPVAQTASSSANPEQLLLPQAPPPGARRSLSYRSAYRPWAELLKRTFAIDVEQCPSCGGRMKLRALVTALTAPCSVERFLRHLGEPTEPPPLSAARDPPFFKSRAVRRKLGDLYDEYAQA